MAEATNVEQGCKLSTRQAGRGEASPLISLLPARNISKGRGVISNMVFDGIDARANKSH